MGDVMGQGRQWVRGFVATIATVAIGIGVAPVVAHAAAAPAIVVTPRTGLASGQTLHVTGSGFAAKQDVAGVECLRGAKDPSACDLGNVAFVTSDANGGFTTTFVAHRTLLTGAGFTDCAPAACEMLFALASDFTKQATTPLAFDPTVPLPKTTLGVKPSAGLLDQQSVTVSGTGFVAGHDIVVTECVVAVLFCGPVIDVTADGGGHFSTAFAVHRILPGAKGQRIDCGKAAGTCELLAVDVLDVDYHTTAPIAFDPSVPPPPPPTLKVDPDTKLPFYARVSVTGTNFAPNDVLLILECASKTALSSCAFVDFVPLDGSGNLTSSPMLQRLLPDPFHPRRPPADCAASGARCVVIAQSTDGTSVSAPVAFDPHAPIPPPPSVTITPAGPYRNNQIVRIKGSNFAPKAGFSVAECATQPNEQDCFSTAGGPQITTANGSLSTQFQVARRLESFSGFVDCLSAGVQCTLEVSSEGGAAVSLPLTFKSKAGIAVAVTPATRIATRGASSWATPARTACPSGSIGLNPARATALSGVIDRACAGFRAATGLR
jgi:hypothetical protein